SVLPPAAAFTAFFRVSAPSDPQEFAAAQAAHDFDRRRHCRRHHRVRPVAYHRRRVVRRRQCKLECPAGDAQFDLADLFVAAQLRAAHRQVDGVTGVSWANWFGGVYITERNFFPQFAIDAPTYLAAYPEFLLSPEEKKDFF